MDKPNLFSEDTDFNICLSWLCDSTDGQTYSINNRFYERMECPEGMDKNEWDHSLVDFCNSEPWESAIGWKHDYRVDDPAARKAAEKMVKDLNALVERLRVEPDWRNWDKNDEGDYLLECFYKNELRFTINYHGPKRRACAVAADAAFSEISAEMEESGVPRCSVERLVEVFDLGMSYRYGEHLFFSFCTISAHKTKTA